MVGGSEPQVSPSLGAPRAEQLPSAEGLLQTCGAGNSEEHQSPVKFILPDQREIQ